MPGGDRLAVVRVTSDAVSAEEPDIRVSAGAVSAGADGDRQDRETALTGTSMANLGYIDDEEDDEPLPWSGSYVFACLLLPMVNGCLSKSFWPCFTLYYVTMSWPLWRCGLAISSGALVHCLMQQVLHKAGLWTSLPVALIHLIFAVLALVYITEEWAIFAEMVCLLGLDAKVAIEGLAFDWFQSEHPSFGLQASASVVASFTPSHVLSFSLGGIIYNFTAWEGIAIFHISCQGLIFAMLLSSPPNWRSLKHFFSGRDAGRGGGMKSIVPEETDDKQWEIQSVGEAADPESPKSPEVGAASGTTRTLAPAQKDEGDQARLARKSVKSAMSTPEEGKTRKSTLTVGSHYSQARKSMARGSIMSRNFQGTGKRPSLFLVATTVTAQRTTTFSRAPAITKRISSWSQRGSTVSVNAVEGRFVVDKDLRLALAARNSTHWGLKEVDADLRFPMTLVACTNWVCHFSMLSQLSTFALLLSRQGWTSAIWAGVAQSGGEVLCIVATLLKGCFSPDEDLEEEDDPPKRGALYRCFSFVFSEPYNVSVYLLVFAAINFCLIIPEAAGVVAAQVLFSTTYALADKAAHDMYVLYSCIGNPDMLYTVVSLGYGAAVVGGIMAGVLTLSLYDIDVMIPFLIIGGLCFMICVQYTAGFCCRVGTDILTSEADRE